MRIALITDAWPPQINGVATTCTTMERKLQERGHEVLVIHPYLFRCMPCPTYAELPLAILPGRAVARRLDRFQPEAIHIVNEGPVGIAARRYCLRRGLPITTVFTTKYPEYIHMRTGISLRFLYNWFLDFHNAAARTCVATAALKAELESRGFRNLVFWERGVDAQRFRPQPKDFLSDPRPICLYVGRIAPEKNLDAFLALELPGTKYVVGRGPAAKRLRQRYPKVRFPGAQTGETLARYYAAADVFVFPSRTDTFGIVMLEAMASGVPVAAFPVVGPRDVVAHGVTGWLDDDLRVAVERALPLDPAACRQRALQYPWERCVDQLESILEPVSRSASCSISVAAALT